MQVTLLRQLRTAVSASDFDFAPKWGFSTAPLSLVTSVNGLRRITKNVGGIPCHHRFSLRLEWWCCQPGPGCRKSSPFRVSSYGVGGVGMTVLMKASM